LGGCGAGEYWIHIAGMKMKNELVGEPDFIGPRSNQALTYSLLIFHSPFFIPKISKAQSKTSN
jgi:hypothetical protein